MPLLVALRAMFIVYAQTGMVLWWLYRWLPEPVMCAQKPHTPLGPSRHFVTRLALFFSIDAFAGGLVVNSLLYLWLMQRFGRSLGAAGRFFFCTSLFSAMFQPAAVPLSREISQRNTVVFMHIPSGLCLVTAAFAWTRSA